MTAAELLDLIEHHLVLQDDDDLVVADLTELLEQVLRWRLVARLRRRRAAA